MNDKISGCAVIIQKKIFITFFIFIYINSEPKRIFSGITDKLILIVSSKNINRC